MHPPLHPDLQEKENKKLEAAKEKERRAEEKKKEKEDKKRWVAPGSYRSGGVLPIPPCCAVHAPGLMPS